MDGDEEIWVSIQSAYCQVANKKTNRVDLSFDSGFLASAKIYRVVEVIRIDLYPRVNKVISKDMIPLWAYDEEEDWSKESD